MTELERLLEDIEKLRSNLLKLIEEKGGDLLDSEVLTASKLLNTMITEYNKFIQGKL